MPSKNEQTDIILEQILSLVSNLNEINSADELDKLSAENEKYKAISCLVSDKFIPREEVDRKIDEFNEILLAYALHSYSDQLELTSNDNDLFNSLATSINILGEELNYSTVARDYIEDIFNSIEDILVVVDNKGTISFINNSTTRILKYTKSEILKRNFELFLDGQTSFDKLVDSAFDKLDIYLLDKATQKVPVSLRVSPFVQGDNMQTGYIIIATDITQQVKYQKEIEKANQELKEALHKAEESDKLKTAFLQNMSHEIRTPLNGIVGFTQLLASDDLTDDSRAEIVRVVEKSSNRLIEIVNNILDIAKIETGQIKVTNTIFNLNDLISDTYEFFVLFAKDKNLELIYHSDLNNERAMIYSDREKLHQVLINLINNAIKFTTKGEVTFGYQLKDDILEFYVKDTGIGIPSDFCEKVFDRFIQVDSAITRNYEGAGLGLSISKGLVEVLDGKMWVESEVNKGATFYFTIPYKPVEQENEPRKNKNLDLETIARPLNIMVAEDDDINFMFVKCLFVNSKVNLVRAVNGKEAVELCTGPKVFDMIFMDLKMPYMSGLEATVIIKEKYPELPIIAITAYGFEEDKQKALNAGCDDFISKPFKRETLLEKMIQFTS
jgi:PAS domain S-box-containing protein